MQKFYSSIAIAFICLSLQSLNAQGVCNPAGNVIIYSNYDGGNMTINIDENIPDLHIGICSYESINVTFTGAYVDNITEVLYAGYDNDGTTSITGVDAGITDILLYPPVTLFDADGYPYMICAYECDSTYVPGGCNTVDQAVDYFMTTFGGSMRYSYFQYGVFTGTYMMSAGGNCCFGASCTTSIDAGQDETICLGDSTQLDVLGGLTFNWSPATGLSNAAIQDPFASPTETTTYVVTATDADGCVGIDSVTVFVLPLPVADITVTGNVLTATGGVSYQWYQDGALIPGATGSSFVVTLDGTYTVLVTDASGCSAMSSAITMDINAIDDLSYHASITIYPNPANAIVQISANIDISTTNYFVSDVTGKTIISDKLPANASISIENLPEGFYTLTLTNDNMQSSVSFIVAH